ncbi:MAG: hypothetical protein J7502_00765 [Flavisolibacter sp.]|nr:hypothetical protein [Flavisolibacter sp.]
MTELDAALPIPAHPAFRVSPFGNVFHNGLPRPLRVRKGRSLKLRFKENGIGYEYGMAKLIAQLFIPNPAGHTRVIFKDGNNHNCTAGNIEWAGDQQFARYSLLKKRPSLQNRKPPAQKIKRKSPSITETQKPCFHPSAVPLLGYNGFYITPCGKLFHGNKPVLPHNPNSKRSLMMRIRCNGAVRRLGLAKLIAVTFLPNPHNHTRIIFKDRNNHNCTLQNIAWASAAEYNAYTESFRTDGLPAMIEKREEEAIPIPGFDGYFITPAGKVFRGNRVLKWMDNGKARSPRVKLKGSNGTIARIAVPKLIAMAFVPNPNNYTKIIFKDRNPQNFSPSNIEWVSLSQFASFVQSDKDLEELRRPKTVKTTTPDNPEAVEMEDFPGYYIAPDGTLYKRGRTIRPRPKGKNGSLQVRLRMKHWPRGKYVYFGLAKLLAQYFIPNPKNHRHVIFKDRNNQNCVVENIAWVDGETFAFYSGISKGAPKMVLPREEAIRKCTDPLLREYYKTLDESWLHDCWNELEKRVQHPYWHRYKSECYIYFLDRAKRFSLLKDPLGLMLAYCKGVKAKLRNEISPDIPGSLLWKTDESLRNTRGSKTNPAHHLYDDW